MVKLKASKLTGLFAAQFKALFIKDVESLVQSKMLFYIVRLFAPSIATLVVFILFITKDTTSFQGIPDT